MESNKTRSRLMFALGVAILVGAFLLPVLNAGDRASALDQVLPSQGPMSTAPGPTDATLTDRLRQEIHEISRTKRELARQSMESALSSLPDRELILDKTCFVLAGDITYEMAHSVPRPEASTGEMVRGSDLDIVVVTTDDLPQAQLRALDQAIYKRKHFLLMHPSYREEIDYLIKSLAKVRQQVAFDTFEHMVACKILREGELLYGNGRVFDAVKALIEEHQIPAKLDAMQEHAARSRERAATVLLDPPESLPDREILTLFYTKEESDEIF